MYWLILIFVFMLSIETILWFVKKRKEDQKRDRQIQILLLADELLSEQIRILERRTPKIDTMELEIAKYLKYTLIYSIAAGYFDKWIIRHAHNWLKAEFMEILKTTAQGEKGNTREISHLHNETWNRQSQGKTGSQNCGQRKGHRKNFINQKKARKEAEDWERWERLEKIFNSAYRNKTNKEN